MIYKIILVEVWFVEGAREKAPFGNVYCPHFVLNNSEDYYSGVQFEALPKAPFGEHIRVNVQLLYADSGVDYSKFTPGASFDIREGGKTVGYGIVIQNDNNFEPTSNSTNLTKIKKDLFNGNIEERFINFVKGSLILWFILMIALAGVFVFIGYLCISNQPEATIPLIIIGIFCFVLSILYPLLTIYFIRHYDKHPRLAKLFLKPGVLKYSSRKENR